MSNQEAYPSTPSPQERKGDLFVDAPSTDALAHCVSQDLRMGKGIADIFKKKFNGVEELKAQKRVVGQVAYLQRDDRYIFYVITKSDVYDKPTQKDFETSLIELRRMCEKFGVNGLSIPRIGTGLDGLSLDFVKDSINKAFEGSSVKVTMFYL